MASVDWKKLKGAGEVKAIVRHNDKEERLKHDHINPHIDKSQTMNNVDLVNLPYKSKCRRYDVRMENLDDVPGQNKRKDRVTGFALSIPVPKDLPSEDEVAWCKQAYKILNNHFGVKNLISADVHMDERHEYLDARTGEKTISRTHLQMVYVSADADDHLCAKNLSSRENMKQLNQKIHEMTKKEFGIEFMDGTQKKSEGSAEEMKNKSEFLEFQKRLEKKEKQLDDAIEKLEKRITKMDEFLEKLDHPKLETFNEKSKQGIQTIKAMLAQWEDEEDENEKEISINI